MTTLTFDNQYIWHPFTQAATDLPPIPIAKAKGSILYGEDGKEYLDLISSWWVNLHGHTHPDICQAITEQVKQLEHVMFANFTHAPAANLAKALTEILPDCLNRVFYSDNGSTAVESALKIAYQYWVNQGNIKRKRFVAFEGGYHGDTFGAMAVGATSGFYSAFKDLLHPVDFIPYPETWGLSPETQNPDVEEKESESLSFFEKYLCQHGAEVAALILEPLIQGSSGMRLSRPQYLEKIVAMAKKCGIIVIFDEIMTGFGRTGTMFAHQQLHTEFPDIICLSKGLTGGFLPLSATVCSETLYEGFISSNPNKTFNHGHSFSANPLGCAAALASLLLFEKESTFDKIKTIGKVHLENLEKFGNTISRPRILGTIAAFNVKDLSIKTKHTFLKEGLVVRPLGDVVYLIPPYCTTEDQLNQAYTKIHTLIRV